MALSKKKKSFYMILKIIRAETKAYILLQAELTSKNLTAVYVQGCLNIAQ